MSGGPDGGDTISAGDGSDYLQGNAGNDTLDGGNGSDRINGGTDDDKIIGGAGGDSINGNRGNDGIDGGNDNDSIRGGQGVDTIRGSDGNDTLFGDLGEDSMWGGTGVDQLTGGADADIFSFAKGDAAFATTGGAAGMTDAIIDFANGVDHFHLGIGSPTAIVQGQAFADFTSAAESAQQLLSTGSNSAVAALQVGQDTYLFYRAGPSMAFEAIRLEGLASPALIDAGDFI